MEASGERENNKNSKVEPRRPGREMTNESSWARILACPDSQVAWFCFAVTGQPVAGGHRLIVIAIRLSALARAGRSETTDPSIRLTGQRDGLMAMGKVRIGWSKSPPAIPIELYLNPYVIAPEV